MVKLSRTSVGRAWLAASGRAGLADRVALALGAGCATALAAAFAALATGVAALTAGTFVAAVFLAALPVFAAAGLRTLFTAAFAGVFVAAFVAAFAAVFDTALVVFAVVVLTALAGAIPYSIVKQAKQYSRFGAVSEGRHARGWHLPG
jgi:hypothetical protein